MGALRMMLGVLMGAILSCGLYSGLDIKYGEKGFLCWSAFSLLVTTLSGGLVYATLVAGLIAGGMAGHLEPFTALLVSLLTSKLLYSYAFRESVDDVQVSRRPYEEEIRDILFRNDPSRLHRVDTELDRYPGQERKLLRLYEAMFAPPAESGSSSAAIAGSAAEGGSVFGSWGRGGSASSAGGGGASRIGRSGYSEATCGDSDGICDSSSGGRGGGGAGEKSILQLAHEEETRRVQATIGASIERITNRMDRRRR